MREIKFRAWNKAQRRWATHDELLGVVPVSANILAPSAITIGNEDSEWIFVQFTGLKDNNGKEIYEGDIVNEGFDSLFEITMGFAGKDIEDEPECWVGSPIGKGNDNDVFGLSNNQTKDCEIIGNIYENPNLLSV